MLRQAIKRVITVALQPSHMIISRRSSSVSSAINSIVLKSLKEHYLEVSKLSPPPKVSPPAPFTVIKGSLDSSGPVLKRSHGEEEISLYVMRLSNITSGGVGDDADENDNGINQLFLHVDISKPGQKESLHFLCGLYPDAIGIHSVSMRPKLDNNGDHTKYHGPDFQDLDERMRDAFHGYIEERGINEALFHFLQAWLYVKDHRNLLRWFRSIGHFVDDQKKPTEAASTG